MSGGLANLLRQSSIDDHEEILHAANAELKQSKNDTRTQHVKVVALLKLERYDEALQTFEQGGDTLKKEAAVEYAYALYRTGKPLEAAKVAAHGNSRGARHVAAQASYRGEDFANAADQYTSLSSQMGQVSNEAVDIRINASAVDAQLEWSGQGHLARSKKAGREDLEAFETAYNAACGSIARGELAQAEILLKRSKDLCNALDDLSEDEKRTEILPITVQQIYVLTRLGRAREAQQLAQDLNISEIADPTSHSIAQINVLRATGKDNPFIAHRLAQQKRKVSPQDQPFRFQSSAMRRDDSAIAFNAQKFDGAARSSRQSLKTVKQPTLDAAVNTAGALSAAAQSRSTTGKEALKKILPELERRPDDIGLLLTIIQLYVLTCNTDTATTLLESFLGKLEHASSKENADVRFAPGLVGLLLSLYSGRGQTAHSRRELAKAAAHWRNRLKASTSLEPSVINLLKAAASELLHSPDAQEVQAAAEIVQSLQKVAREDTYIQMASLATKTSRGQSGTSELPSIERLTKGIDVDALETAGIAKPPQQKSTSTSKRPATQSTAPKKKRKIKPCKMPKDFDASKQPDPERWLPLRDRSTYKPKGKKGKQRANMLAQGAVEETSRPGTPSQVVEAKGGAGKGQAKKKKGKGGKW